MVVFGIRELPWYDKKDIEIVYPKDNPSGVYSEKILKNMLFRKIKEITLVVVNNWHEECLFEFDFK